MPRIATSNGRIVITCCKSIAKTPDQYTEHSHRVLLGHECFYLHLNTVNGSKRVARFSATNIARVYAPNHRLGRPYTLADPEEACDIRHRVLLRPCRKFATRRHSESEHAGEIANEDNRKESPSRCLGLVVSAITRRRRAQASHSRRSHTGATLFVIGSSVRQFYPWFSPVPIQESGTLTRGDSAVGFLPIGPPEIVRVSLRSGWSQGAGARGVRRRSRAGSGSIVPPAPQRPPRALGTPVPRRALLWP